MTQQLDHDRLVEVQRETLATPRMRYGILAGLLFRTLDAFYGRERTLSKFKILELIARVPYQAWEQVQYIAITHTAKRPHFARRIFDRIRESRAQQDNEQWHLFILEELTARNGARESFVLHWLIPQIIAFFYYQASFILYVVRPASSYRLNARFEDHAEHEYMLFVQEHPEFETTPVDIETVEDYGRFDSLADLFRQIAYDERVHKEESLAAMRSPRFE